MTDEPFVDAHVHFWDRSVSELQWVRLDSGSSAHRFGSADGYRGSSYLPPDLMAEADGTGLAGVVGVERPRRFSRAAQLSRGSSSAATRSIWGCWSTEASTHWNEVAPASA